MLSAYVVSSQDLQQQVVGLVLDGMITTCFKQCQSAPYNISNHKCVQNCGRTYLQTRQKVADAINSEIAGRISKTV